MVNQKRRAAVFLASILALLLLLTYICEDSLIFKRVKTLKIENVDFEGRPQDPRVEALKAFPQVDDYSFKSVDIRFRMKVHSIVNYDNLFQTAPVNSGVRLELSKPSTLALIVGLNDPAAFKGFILTRSLQPEKWYSVFITITRDKHLSVLLDGKTIVDSTHRNIRFNLSDIVLGTGFSRTRPFDGSIQDFSLKAQFFRKSYGRERTFTMVKIILISALVTLIFGFLSAYKKGLEPSAKVGVAGLIILFGFVLSVFCHYIDAQYLGRFLHATSTGAVDGNVPGSLIVNLFTKWKILLFLTILPALGYIVYNYRGLSASLSEKTGRAEFYTHLLIFSLLGYPFLLAIDQLSPELLVFVLLALFVHFFSLKKFHEAAFLLGIAAAFRVYPLILLAVFFVHKQYRPTVFSFLPGALITSAVLALSSVVYTHLMIIPCLTDLKTLIHMSPGSMLNLESSLFGCLRLLSVSLFHLWSDYQLLKLYVCVAPVLFLVVVYYVVRVEPEFWKQLLFLFIAVLLLMPVSPDARFTVLLVPFWLFARRKNLDPSDVFYTTAIAALLIPKEFFVIYQGTGQTGPFHAVIGTILNPLIMTIIIFKGISEALKARKISTVPASCRIWEKA